MFIVRVNGLSLDLWYINCMVLGSYLIFWGFRIYIWIMEIIIVYIVLFWFILNNVILGDIDFRFWNVVVVLGC